MIIEQLYTNTGEIFNDSLGNEFLVLSIDIETAPAVIDAPLLQQTNKLSFVDVLHVPFEIDTPTLAQSHTAQPVGTAPAVIDAPLLQQTHSLSTMSIEQLYTNTGEIFNDSLGNEFLVLSIDIETAPAVIDAPLLQQTNKLSFVDVLHVPFEIDTPTLAQSHTAQPVGVELQSPTISRPILPELGLYPATIDRTAMVFEEVRITIL